MSLLVFQKEYFKKYGGDVIPVQPNDVFFTMHAVALTLITIFQCLIYEVGQAMFDMLSLLYDCWHTLCCINRQKFAHKLMHTFLAIATHCYT